MPALYIITGSNGAGKSTVGPDYLPQAIRENYTVFDGDLLFMKKSRELFPHLIRSPKEAKKIAYQHVSDTFDQLVDEALEKRSTFVYEGHFTNDSTWDTPKRFKESGYQTHLIFFGLIDPDLSQLRVTDRVIDGGHFVDRLTIEANFSGNLEKLNQYHHLIDYLTIVDTSEISHTTLVTLAHQKVHSSVTSDELPAWFNQFLPDIVKLIADRNQ